MKILNIHSTKGPNYWSVRRSRLIVMRLDLESLEDKPTNEIKGFCDRLKKHFPGIYDHHCSEGVPGGFLTRVKRGTWMGHVIEHLALELQVMAGLEVGFGRTRSSGKTGEYFVVFEYVDQEAGELAARLAVKAAGTLVYNRKLDVKALAAHIRETACTNQPGPSTNAILQEAQRRNIPCLKIDDSLYQLGYGSAQQRFGATISSRTSGLGIDIACDKEACKNILSSMGIPMPAGGVVNTKKELAAVINDLGFPVVLKPISGNHGRGVTIHVTTLKEAHEAFAKARKISSAVMVERFIPGHDHRLLVIDKKFVAAAKRTPAHITGNGFSTIKELVKWVNKDPNRGDGHEKPLTRINLDANARHILRQKGYNLNTVLKPLEVLFLAETANISTGGTAEDVTDIIHPCLKGMAERIARIIDLDICGIDIVTTDISKPLEKTFGAVLEVNAAPGFRMHTAPSKGFARNVAAPLLDMLFPKGNNGRIPIVAVTGTNGKTTTTRLVAHMLKKAGKQVGYTTTDGIYIQNEMVMKGDCTGPHSAEIVLRDPAVNVAVLETARGGLLQSGLAFDQCDIGIVTNVASDHLGLNGINTLEKMARVKSVIPESVSCNGYAILNADDDLVCKMRENLHCKIALFSLSAINPRIKTHIADGGLAAYVDENYLVIREGDKTYRIEQVDRIPLTFNGKASFMVENILPATLSAYIQNVSFVDIRAALYSFLPSPAQTPGRMNFFHFSNFDVVVDYAHNPAGLKAVGRFLENSDYTSKVGIVAGIGDRREEDCIGLGLISATIFDELIIREDEDLRGRQPGELTTLVKKGALMKKPKMKITAIARETDALQYAIKSGQNGSIIWHCTENISEMLKLAEHLRKMDKASKTSPIAHKQVLKTPMKPIPGNILPTAALHENANKGISHV